MVWFWRYLDEEGNLVVGSGRSEAFTSRSDAETWLGEEWRDLLEQGVAQVALVESEDDGSDDKVTVHSTMELSYG